MDEQKTDKETKPTTPEGSVDNGNEPEVLKDVKDARAAAAELRKENDRKEKLQKIDIELAAQRELGGGTPAGESSKPKEIDSKQYAEDVLANKLNDIKKE